METSGDCRVMDAAIAFASQHSLYAQRVSRDCWVCEQLL